MFLEKQTVKKGHVTNLLGVPAQPARHRAPLPDVLGEALTLAVPRFRVNLAHVQLRPAVAARRYYRVLAFNAHSETVFNFNRNKSLIAIYSIVVTVGESGQKEKRQNNKHLHFSSLN